MRCRRFYVGAPCVLMAPNAFMQRPLNWLRAISHYRAEVVCSPNFGYDLCVSRYRPEQMDGVDLSYLEDRAQRRRSPSMPRPSTQFAEKLRRMVLIRARSIRPTGMAEATLLISGGSRGGGHVTRRCQPRRAAGP